MILGLGIDLERVDRFAELIARWGDRFTHKLFTPAERQYCDARGKAAQHYAARFAAKEAALKALGVPRGIGLEWHHFEILRVGGGAPTLSLHGAAAAHAATLGVQRIHLSLTHSDDSAAAVVVLEGEAG